LIKMTVLLYMLKRGTLAWNQPVKPVESAALFYQYYMEKEYRKRIDANQIEGGVIDYERWKK
jgi:hypothetical protein